VLDDFRFFEEIPNNHWRLCYDFPFSLGSTTIGGIWETIIEKVIGWGNTVLCARPVRCFAHSQYWTNSLSLCFFVDPGFHFWLKFSRIALSNESNRLGPFPGDVHCPNIDRWFTLQIPFGFG
jgi:hypothetical protein